MIKKDANPYDRSIYFSQGAFDLALEKIKKLKIKNLILSVVLMIFFTDCLS